MKAITSHPHNGWHFHRDTLEWKLYAAGRLMTTVAAEIWEDYKRWRKWNRVY